MGQARLLMAGSYEMERMLGKAELARIHYFRFQQGEAWSLEAGGRCQLILSQR